ncbi:MAG TPA: hypothetical protein VN437_04915 [Rectinemataceae bacterium]|nr:hypothetical protein [Rectinemataceae bacterium]
MKRKNPYRIGLVLLVATFAVVSLPADSSRFQSVTITGEQVKKKDKVLVQAILSDSQAYKKASESLLVYFRDVFMKTDEFKGSFGETTWEEISQEVEDSMDIVRDRKMESTVYNDKVFAFIGMIYDFLAEVIIDRSTGEPKEITIEMW